MFTSHSREIIEAMKHHQLLKAVKRGDVEEFKELADNLLNALSPQKNTVLHVAARFGHTSLVQEIFQRQKELLFLKNHQGDTPMHVAARAGHTGAITCLIDCAKITVQNTCQNGTDIESGSKEVQKVLRMTDNEGNTPLHGAVLNRRLRVVKILIKEDPELSGLTNKAGESPLAIAVDVKASDILHTIITPNMSSSILDMGRGGQTLLHGTVIRHDLASMDIFLDTNPQLVSKKDRKRRSPLHYAAAFGYLEMVERLLESDASLAYEGDISGQMPVHLAAGFGHVTALTKLLDECPDSIELLDKKHRNVLHLAAQNGKIDTVQYILKLPEMEDLVNAEDKFGDTPLHLSARNLQGDMVHYLLQDPRVNIWTTNFYGATALKMVESLERRQVYSVNGEADMRKIGNDSETEDTADSAYDKKKELLKVLKVAKATQAEFPKDICVRKTTDSDRETAKSLMMIATLVAAFTFTAVFNVPGGFKAEGVAALSNNAAFQAFVILDTIAMTSSMTAAVMVFWSSWGPNNELFLEILTIAIWLTRIALTTTGLAFVTGLFAVLSNTKWLAIVVCVIGCGFPAVASLLIPFMSVGLTGFSLKRDSIGGKIIQIFSAAMLFSPTARIVRWLLQKRT